MQCWLVVQTLGHQLSSQNLRSRRRIQSIICKTYNLKLTVTKTSLQTNSPDGCPKLNPDAEDVVVLLPNKDPCANPELCPNAGVELCPKSPVLVLLAVLPLLVPKEKELALLAVAAPKRLAPVVAMFEPAPNPGVPKENPLDVPVLLAG